VAYFASQPTPGTVIISAKCKITNAGNAVGWIDDSLTSTYQTVASSSQGETPPVGYAEALYNILSVLHQQGTLEITEQECSNRLPVGCVFNTVDGLAEWQDMDGLVLSVEENINDGKTTVEFGPTLHLGLQEMVELRRANTGRLLSYAMNQRTTGKTSSGSTIQGPNQSGASSSHMPPGGGSSVQAGPFELLYGPSPSVPGEYVLQVKLNGVFLNTDGSEVAITMNGIPITPTAPSVKVNLDGNDTVWIEGAVTSLACATVAIKSYGNGDSGYSTSQYWVTGGLTENDGATPPNQTILRKVLAVFVAGAKGQPTLQTQQTTTNLQMKNNSLGFLPALYPAPS
jgi:hypothetical protein